MEDQLKTKIKSVLEKLQLPEVDFTVSVIEDQTLGDQACNVAMVLAKQAGKNPRTLAEEIKNELQNLNDPLIERIEVAGPGFINFFYRPDVFVKNLEVILGEGNEYGKNGVLAGKRVMIEYTDPNPFKVFHIGHLMPNVIGESLSRLVEFSGAEIKRANYQGDVGLHVAKAIWGLLKTKGDPKNIDDISSAYVEGSNAYEDNPESKTEIDALNKRIYAKDPELGEMYDLGRKTSLDHFEEIYKKLGTKFDYYFFESEVADRGVATVKAHPETFVQSDGAIVFKGEEVDPKLHTRVFINSQGLPTYETKELGLIQAKRDVYDFDESITVTASEQTDYFRVVMAAMRRVIPELGTKMKHIAHGMLRFAEGKMSSRKGNVITGESLIADVEELVRGKMTESPVPEHERSGVITDVAIGAIKFSILKQAVGRDIVYDFEKSISFEGDSGPYLQYTHARIKSVLAKAGNIVPRVKAQTEVGTLEKLLAQFPDMASTAAKELAPQHIITYLLELASAFNSYYAQNKIIDLDHPEQSEHRLALAAATAQVIKNGLWLLGIRTPERM